MKKILLVAGREFRVRVRSRGFILSSLALPIFLIFMWVITGNIGNGGGGGDSQDSNENTPSSMGTVGYVDQAAVIEHIPEMVPQELFAAYTDETAAQAALEAGEIEAYYVVTADYRESGEVLRFSEEFPTDPPENALFDIVLINNLFSDQDQAFTNRLYWPFNGGQPQFQSLAKEGESNDGGFSMLPFIVTIAVMMPLFTSGGYLLQSVAQEKSGRIMEILLLSLKPWHLLIGKLLGLGGLTLVQYLIWVVLAVLGANLFGVELSELLADIQLTGEELMLVLPFALGGYLLYAGIMAGVGALAANIEGSRSWVTVISLPMMLPIYLWAAIVETPNGVLARLLSMIPFSAPVAMMMRMTSTNVPMWELVASLALLLLSALGMIWMMAKLFRVQTLLSGETLSLRRFAEALRS